MEWLLPPDSSGPTLASGLVHGKACREARELEERSGVAADQTGGVEPTLGEKWVYFATACARERTCSFS